MPSDSIAGFLDQAQASRVLFPEQVEQLIRQADVPQAGLASLVQYLEQRGVLTRFQAAMLGQGRGQDLSVAGYPVLDELGPVPGGTAYKALHPSLRTPITIRRLRPEALLPADTAIAFVTRAQAATALHHPNLIAPLDAGMYRNEPYVAAEIPADTGDIGTLVQGIGPMPGFLAAEYGRQTAAALRVIHERGLWHGDVRPATLLIGPLTNQPGPGGKLIRRPTPTAAVRLSGLGFVPVRPAAALITPPHEVLAYLPPERVAASAYDPRGDLYGLGATLYHLLTGRPPFAADTPEALLEKVRTAEPAPLAALRPDLPANLVAAVNHLMAKRPDRRTPTAADAEAALAPFCRPGTAPPPASHPQNLKLVAVPAGAPIPVPVAEHEDAWGGSFAPSHADSAPPRPRPQRTAKDKARARIMIALGLMLHITAVVLVILWLTGGFNSEKEPPKKKRSHGAAGQAHE